MCKQVVFKLHLLGGESEIIPIPGQLRKNMDGQNRTQMEYMDLIRCCGSLLSQMEKQDVVVLAANTRESLTQRSWHRCGPRGLGLPRCPRTKAAVASAHFMPLAARLPSITSNYLQCPRPCPGGACQLRSTKVSACTTFPPCPN